MSKTCEKFIKKGRENLTLIFIEIFVETVPHCILQWQILNSYLSRKINDFCKNRVIITWLDLLFILLLWVATVQSCVTYMDLISIKNMYYFTILKENMHAVFSSILYIFPSLTSICFCHFSIWKFSLQKSCRDRSCLIFRMVHQFWRDQIRGPK